MYRTPDGPAPVAEVITLAPRRSRRVVVAVAGWLLGSIFMGVAVAWVGMPLVRKEDYFTIPLGLLLAATYTWLMVRLDLSETVEVGNLGFHRQGYFWRSSMRWEDVTGTKVIVRRQGNKTTRFLGVAGRDGAEVVIAPWAIADPNGTVRWALDKATAGLRLDIDARVRREGQRPRRLAPYLFHGLLSLVCCAAMGTLIFAK